MGFVIKQPRSCGEAELAHEDHLIQSKGERAELRKYLKLSASNCSEARRKISALKDKLPSLVSTS